MSRHESRHQEAWRSPHRHGRSSSESGLNRRTAANGERVPLDEIATAIAAARGALLIALRLGKVSSRKGQRVAEPFVTMAAPISSSTVEYELRWLSQVQRLASLYR